MDYINKLFDKAPGWIKELFDKNRWTTLSLVAVGALAFSSVGCDYLMKTVSPVSGKKVNQLQLDTDYETWQVQYKAKVVALQLEGQVMEKKFEGAQAVLDAERAVLDKVVGTLGSAIQSVPAPWTGLLATALPILTVGLGLDNRRKDQVISANKEIAAAAIQVKDAVVTGQPTVIAPVIPTE